MKTKYVGYNDKRQIASLDKNVWNTSLKSIIPTGETGRYLYRAPDTADPSEPRHPSRSICEEGRDPETHYVLGLDRFDHPDHSSRFGYANCPNGYCSGHWPGRYNEGTACANNDPQPLGMAPARFYEPQNLGAFVDTSVASANRKRFLDETAGLSYQ